MSDQDNKERELTTADSSLFPPKPAGAGWREIVKQPMGELVEATLLAASRSENTARAYRKAIGLFLQYLETQQAEEIPTHLSHWRPFVKATQDKYRRQIWEFRTPVGVLRWVTPEIVDGFRAWRQDEGDSTNAVALRMAAVRTFLAVAYRKRVISSEQAQAMQITAYRPKQKRDEQPTGRRLMPAEVRQLRGAVDGQTIKGKRDRAILDLMLFAGLRRDEVAHLQLPDFRQEQGRWWLVITGKGQQTRRVKVHDTLCQSVNEWLVVSNKKLVEGEGYLFEGINKWGSMSGKPLNGSVVGRLVAEYGNEAGLAPLHGENRLAPHDLRRTCARNAYDNNASLLLVQQMLGHRDPKTTARYIGTLDNDDTAVDHVHY